MTFPFYKGDGKQRDRPMRLPQSHRADLTKPEHYLADPGLRDACNVALLLGQPLLLTGEPGTGKTQFAYSLAWELGLDKPLKFETKSTSTARDLFYTYDALKRFQDIQSGSIVESVLPYLFYQALGLAIVRTKDPVDVADMLPSECIHTTPCRSVVLIDEVDKAPRDFPNDILNELEHMYFRVPELNNQMIEANPALHPVLVITSNSEKDLPDAFLRRCIYYNIPFPDRERLIKIISNHLGHYVGGSSAFLDDALTLFELLRAPAGGLRKKPATAELLGWLITLREMGGDAQNPLTEPNLVMHALSTLIKTAEDQQKATQVMQQWIQKRQSAERG